MDPPGEQRMRPIPIAQYLNRFERAEPTALETSPRQSPFAPKPRVAPAADDIESRLREAYEKGRHDGFASARNEADAVFADHKDEQEERAKAERLAFQANECAKFAEQIATGLIEIEGRIAATVADILRPYLAQEQTSRVIKALSENLARILSGDSPAVLKISGPEFMLSVLRDRLSNHPAPVEYSVEEGLDVTVEAQQTIIKSQLQTWSDLIESTAFEPHQ
jgi:hypothetical protein